MLFIPRFGSIGAVIGTLVAETTITVLYVIHDRGYLTPRQMLFYAWKKCAAAGCMFLVILLVNRLIQKELLSIVIDVAAGAAVYIMVLAALKDSFIERILIGKILKKRRRSG